MKLLNLAMVLMASPLINALADSNGNDGKDMKSSFLESPVKSRSSSLADDICIDYCTGPDSVQEGICLKNRCRPAGDCVNVKGFSVTNSYITTDVMVNITLADNDFCGVWTALDCKQDGQDSFAAIHESTGDLKTKMKAYAKSYRCYHAVVEELKDEVLKERPAPAVTAVGSMRAEKEISKREPCIHVDWSSTPDTEQFGENFSDCFEPNVYYIVTQPLPGGLASIHFDYGFACDLYSNSGCVDLGRKSHAFVVHPYADITPLLKEGVNDGRAHCWKCRSNPNHDPGTPDVQKNSTGTRRNAIQEGEALPVVQSTEITETSMSGSDICIDFCDQPDSSPNRHCFLKNCASPGTCMNINSQVLSGIGSIHFGDGINCDVYRASDCKVDGRNSHSQIRRGISDLTGLLQGSAHSYKCEPANNRGGSKQTVETRGAKKAGINARSKFPPSIAARSDKSKLVATISKRNLESVDAQVGNREELGACVDHCTGPDFTGNCTRNQCMQSADCVAVSDGGIGSIKFGGSTHCTLYLLDNCQSSGSAPLTVIKNPTNDVKAFAGWTLNTAKSFRCSRPYKKRDIHSIDSTTPKAAAATAAEIAVRDVAAPQSCVEYCTGSNYTGECKSVCTKNYRCVNVGVDSFNSLRFDGQIICWVYVVERCSPEWPVAFLESVADIEIEASFKPMSGASFMCRRLDD